MENLFNIYNENFGRAVATYKDYIAVGNPNSKDFNIEEGYSRIGEVTVYKKNSNNNDYSVYFRCSASIASVRERGLFTSLEHIDDICDGTESSDTISRTLSILYQSKYGTAIDMCNNLLVVGDFSCSIEKNPTEPNSFITFGRVDIYDLSNPGKEDDNFYKEPILTLDPYTNTPFTAGQFEDSRYGLRENNDKNEYCRGYGYSVAINNNYIFVGSPFTIDNTKFANDIGTFISPIENSPLKPNVHGVVFAYRYTFEDGKFSIVRDDGSYLHRDYFFNPEVITPKEEFYNNFGYFVSADKTEEKDIPEIVYDEQSEKYPTSSLWYKCTSSRALISSFRQYRDTSDTTKVINEPVVYLCNNFENNSWQQSSIFTSSITLNEQLDFIEPKSHIEFKQSEYNLFGINTAFNNDCLVIGSPTEITYSEFKSGTIYSTEHNKGAAYIYINCGIYDEPKFHNKVFGGENTLKDNFFGISVDVLRKDENTELISIGSPRSSIDYTVEFISSSVYDEQYNIVSGYPFEKTYNGQVILYQVVNGGCLTNGCYDEKSLKLFGNYPINSRKEYGKSFGMFGYSAKLSDTNIVIGSPLNELYCLTCEDVNNSNSTEVFRVEDDYNTWTINNVVVFGEDNERLTEIQGRAFVYNFNDYVENYKVGNVFYNNNKLIINTDNNICNVLIADPKLKDKNITLNGSIKGKVYLHEMQYICTVEPGEFNVSTNLTAREIKPFNYRITNKFKFLFEDLDYILRYINLNVNNNEKWWQYIIEDDVEQSILDYYNLSKDNRLIENKLQNYSGLIKYIETTFKLDINEDDCVDLKDAKLIWKYFIDRLTIDNYKQLLSNSSKLEDYDLIIQKLDKYTGKNYEITIDPEFSNYSYSSSIDVTGSYLAPYITQVGLYNNADLLALAKLAHPIKNTNDLPINIVVKFDY